jgi:hypothetical protein
MCTIICFVLITAKGMPTPTDEDKALDLATRLSNIREALDYFHKTASVDAIREEQEKRQEVRGKLSHKLLLARGVEARSIGRARNSFSEWLLAASGRGGEPDFDPVSVSVSVSESMSEAYSSSSSSSRGSDGAGQQQSMSGSSMLPPLPPSSSDSEDSSGEEEGEGKRERGRGGSQRCRERALQEVVLCKSVSELSRDMDEWLAVAWLPDVEEGGGNYVRHVCCNNNHHLCLC